MSETLTAPVDPNAPPSSPPSSPATPATTTPTPGNETWARNWVKQDGSLDPTAFEKAPDEFKPLGKDLSRYKTWDDFIKGHKELASLAGKKGLVDPLPKDATPEMLAERSALLRKVNGAPDKPEGYGLVRPETVPETMWDQNYANRIAEIAHKHGIAPGALQDLAKAEVEYTQAAQQAQAKADEEFFQKQDQLIRETLQKEGMDFAKGQDLAQRAGRKYGVDPSNPLMKNATVFMLLTRIGNAIKEDEIITGEMTQMGLTPNMTPDQAEKAADDIQKNKDNPLFKAFHDRGHPDHETAKNKWLTLIKAMHRGK